VAFLIWLIYFKGGTGAPTWISFLPPVNATLNFMSAVCLWQATCGFVAAKSQLTTIHDRGDLLFRVVPR